VLDSELILLIVARVLWEETFVDGKGVQTFAGVFGILVDDQSCDGAVIGLQSHPRDIAQQFRQGKLARHETHVRDSEDAFAQIRIGDRTVALAQPRDVFENPHTRINRGTPLRRRVAVSRRISAGPIVRVPS